MHTHTQHRTHTHACAYIIYNMSLAGQRLWKWYVARMGDIRPEQARTRMRKAAAAGERQDQSVTQKAVCAQDQRTKYGEREREREERSSRSTKSDTKRKLKCTFGEPQPQPEPDPARRA